MQDCVSSRGALNSRKAGVQSAHELRTQPLALVFVPAERFCNFRFRRWLKGFREAAQGSLSAPHSVLNFVPGSALRGGAAVSRQPAVKSFRLRRGQGNRVRVGGQIIPDVLRQLNAFGGAQLRNLRCHFRYGSSRHGTSVPLSEYPLLAGKQQAGRREPRALNDRLYAHHARLTGNARKQLRITHCRVSFRLFLEVFNRGFATNANVDAITLLRRDVNRFPDHARNSYSFHLNTLLLVLYAIRRR